MACRFLGNQNRGIHKIASRGLKSKKVDTKDPTEKSREKADIIFKIDEKNRKQQKIPVKLTLVDAEFFSDQDVIVFTGSGCLELIKIIGENEDVENSSIANFADMRTSGKTYDNDAQVPKNSNF
jgi:hypothetical protein